MDRRLKIQLVLRQKITLQLQKGICTTLFRGEDFFVHETFFISPPSSSIVSHSSRVGIFFLFSSPIYFMHQEEILGQTIALGFTIDWQRASKSLRGQLKKLSDRILQSHNFQLIDSFFFWKIAIIKSKCVLQPRPRRFSMMFQPFYVNTVATLTSLFYHSTCKINYRFLLVIDIIWLIVMRMYSSKRSTSTM